MEEEGQLIAEENLEVIKLNPGECILELVEQTVELAESAGEAQHPGIATHSASTKLDSAVSSGEDGSFEPEKVCW